MKWLIDFLTYVGLAEAAFLVFGIAYGFYLWCAGIFPVLLRLGNGLARRRIAIFAKGDNLTSIKGLLLDSKLFKEKNIRVVTQSNNMEASADASVYIVYWPDWSADISAILERKPDSCALIVYQPYDQGRIPDDQMKMLDGKRHTAVTNFRGRLLNDIVTSMITTSYEKKSD